MHDLHKDGGFKSRKMWMAYVTMLLLLLGYLATGKWSALVAVYPTYCMGLLSAAAVFTGSNVLVKHLALKNLPKTEKPDQS